MKILATGDFHGTFPKKFEKIIKREKIELVVSNGDFQPFLYRDLWFKHCYASDKNLWDVIGKEKYKKLILRDLKETEKALRKLNDLPVPVITVLGNVDSTRTNDVYDLKKPTGKKYWALDYQDFFSPLLKKYPHIQRFDYSYFAFGDYVFIGMNGGSNIGKVKSKAYRKSRRVLDKLFRKFKKENKERKIIFVSHNSPYNSKLDLVGKKAHAKVAGKHIGSKLMRRIIDKYNPLLTISGHIHESKGMQKLGRTMCVNPGSAHEGQGAIIELNGKKVKVKLI